MSINEDRERLAQRHNLEWIRRDLKATDMVTVVRWDLENLRLDYFILGGLIPANLVEEILSGEHTSDVIENVWAEPAAYAPSGERQIIVKPENICTPPVGAVSNRTESGVKVITDSTINTFAGVLRKTCTGRNLWLLVVSLVK